MLKYSGRQTYININAVGLESLARIEVIRIVMIVVDILKPVDAEVS